MSNTSLPPAVWPDSPRVRRTDPETSHLAADLTQSSVSASQAAVLAVLRDALMPLTAADLERYLAHSWRPSRVRTALTELEEQGLVEVAGTVQSRPGRKTMCRVWRAIA